MFVDLAPFDEMTRTGFWKLLTVRDFFEDCMIILTVHPHADENTMNKAKQLVIERLADFSAQQTTSVYWQILNMPSDPCVYEHIHGLSNINSAFKYLCLNF